MDALAALVHWLHLLALALWTGSLVMLLVVLRGRRVRPEDVVFLEQARRRCATIAHWSVIILIVTLALEIAVRALVVAGGHVGVAFTGSALRGLLFNTRYGLASVVRWLLLVASLWAVDEFAHAPTAVSARAPRPGRQALGIVAPRPRPPRLSLTRDAWTRVACALAVAVLICAAIAGPYGVTPAAAMVEAVHLTATTVWLGGAIVLAVAVTPWSGLVDRTRRPAALLTLLNRFSPVAMLSLLLLIASGLWEATRGPRISADHVPAVVGGARSLKALVLVAIFVLSGLGSLNLRPRLRRLAVQARRDPLLAPRVERAFVLVQRALRLNALLAMLALFCGAVADSIPIQVVAIPTRAPLILAGHAGAIGVTLRIAPNTAGPNTFDIYLADARARGIARATVVLAARSLEMRGTSPPPITATALGNGRYRGHGVLSAGGRWSVRVRVQTASGHAVALFPVTVPPGTAGVTLPQGAPTGTSGARRLTSTSWRLAGPVMITHTVAVDPVHRGWLYVGTINGVYRSIDDGTRWQSASLGLARAALGVWSLGFLPDGSLIAATSAGVYRSTDNAGHWVPAGLMTHDIYTLAAHLVGRIVLLAGGDGGIFRSADGGAHWRQIYHTGPDTAVVSLAWPLARPALIVAGMNPGPRPVTISTDAGITWHAQTRGLPGQAGMMSVTVAPGARTVYAGSMGQGIFALEGTDFSAPAGHGLHGGGGVWQQRNRGMPGARTGEAHVGSFAFAPGNARTIYAATDFGVYRSADAGGHWAPFGSGLSGDAAIVTALTLIAGPHPTLYAATAAGLYRRSLYILPARRGGIGYQASAHKQRPDHERSPAHAPG